MIFEKKNNFWLFFGVMLACFVISAGMRYQQFEIWKKNPDAFFVGERPMMTTLDAPYWLRWAREYNQRKLGEKGGLRSYPDNTKTFKEKLVKEVSLPQKYKDPIPSTNNYASTSVTKKIHYNEVPLLSFLIAIIAPISNYNYYLTGTLLVPILASLFILPLGLYFFQVSVPVSGLLGGLIGTFASGYYMRSSIGRIDTDMLNLFFPVFSALMILQAARSKTDRNVLIYSIVAGLSLFLFQWWYDKAGFTLLYFAVLVFSLFVYKISFRTILVAAFLFLLSAKPAIFMDGTVAIQQFLEGYLTIGDTLELVNDNNANPAIFPNTMTTISEVDIVPITEVMRRVLSNTTIAWIGFLAFFVFALFRWRVLLPLTPILALGLLSFKSSNRFIMYLAPFIGIGLGFLLQLGVNSIVLLTEKIMYPKKDKRYKGKSKNVKESLWAKLISWVSTDGDENGLDAKLIVGPENTQGPKDSVLKEGNKALKHKWTQVTGVDWWNWVRQVVLYLVMGVSFWMISGQTAISFVPGPSIHPRVYATFLEVKERIPENSALLTWWDYGYAITDATGLSTFHDGGSQKSPKTYFTARGLISSDQHELYDITQYLSTEGNRGIAENNTSPEALLIAIRNPKHKPWDPIYLFFTADMTGKYGAISKLGSWDIEKGGSHPMAYQNLACNKISNEGMNCRGAKIDLKAGKINKQVPLRRLVFIREGQVLREEKFGHAQGYTLQLIIVGKNIVEVQLIDESVFLSNYNQMFLLGRYRDDLFEESYNAFPFSRLFRVKF